MVETYTEEGPKPAARLEVSPAPANRPAAQQENGSDQGKLQDVTVAHNGSLDLLEKVDPVTFAKMMVMANPLDTLDTEAVEDHQSETSVSKSPFALDQDHLSLDCLGNGLPQSGPSHRKSEETACAPVTEMSEGSSIPAPINPDILIPGEGDQVQPLGVEVLTNLDGVGYLTDDPTNDPSNVEEDAAETDASPTNGESAPSESNGISGAEGAASYDQPTNVNAFGIPDSILTALAATNFSLSSSTPSPGSDDDPSPAVLPPAAQNGASGDGMSDMPDEPDMGAIPLDMVETPIDPVPALPINNPPLAKVIGLQTATEDMPFSIDLSDSFQDVDGDTLRFAMTENAPAWLSIDAATGMLTGTPDNDDVGTHTVTVIAVDPRGADASLEVLVNVGNVNDAPTGLLLTNTTIAENSSGELVVATLAANDPDAFDTHAFTLISSSSASGLLSPEDTPFEIIGNELRLRMGALLDFETDPVYDVTIEVGDAGGLTHLATVSISVLDVAETIALSDGGDVFIDGGIAEAAVIGGNGDDTITGSTGNDSIDGGAGNDLLSGGAGDDTIFSGRGGDTIDGGEGSDTIYLDNVTNGQVNVVTDSGLMGTDRIVLTGSAVSHELQNDFSVASGIEIIDGSLLSGETLHSVGAVTFDFSGVTLIGVDLVAGSEESDTIIGSSGDDVIDGREGADSLLGGDGDDTIFAGEGADTVDGGAGSDTIYLHNLSVDGNNHITDSGTSGIDRLILTGDPKGYEIQNDFSAASGIEIVDGSALSGETLTSRGALNFDLSSITLIGVDLIAGGSDKDTIIGSSGDDVIDGREGADSLLGGDGDDTIFAGEGADTVDGGAGSDTIYLHNLSVDGNNHITDSGTSGIDRLILTGDPKGYEIQNDFSAASGIEIVDGSALSGETLTSRGALNFDLSSITLIGVDLIAGGSDKDTIIGSSGDDVIDGREGADSLFGGAGDDTIFSGRGGDVIDGGEGSDTIYLHNHTNGQINTVTDSGSTGTDRIILTGSANTHELQSDFSASSGIEIIDGSGLVGENLISVGVVNFDFSGVTLIDVDLIRGGAENDTIIGSSGADNIEGGAADDVLSGGDGDDTLVGDSGADLLSGDAGNDVLEGGGGNDTLSGGDGVDTLYGEDGHDLFLVTQGEGNDVIEGGGGSWTDTIEIQPLADGSALNWTIDLDPGATVTSSGANVLTGTDLSGTITFDDGTEIDFREIEQIQW